MISSSMEVKFAHNLLDIANIENANSDSKEKCLIFPLSKICSVVFLVKFVSKGFLNNHLKAV